MKFLSMDSPLMQGLGKMADLMILNLLALVCCIPVVTVGATMTALHYMTLKIVRDEEVYIVKGFLKSFKENFKQATIIWLLQLVCAVILGLDFFLLFSGAVEFPFVIQVMMFVVGVMVTATFLMVYPVLSKFDNTLVNTLKNAFLMAVLQFPKVVLIFILWLLPAFIAIFVPQVIPLVILFGMSLPALCSSFLYNKFFQKTEQRMMEKAIEAGEVPYDAGAEDEHIFSDELVIPSDKDKQD